MLNRLMEKKKVSQDKDVKDKDGTQPAKYYAGDMSKSTKDKREMHTSKQKRVALHLAMHLQRLKNLNTL